MNRLVIIGNGFDLAHGLKTSYKDFIDWYWGQRVDKLYQEDPGNHDDGLCSINLRYAISPSPNSNSNRSAKQVIDDMVELKLCSMSYHELLERITMGVETKTWAGIEQDYYDLLKEYAFGKVGDIPWGEFGQPIEGLNMQMAKLQEKLVEYLCYIEKTTEGIPTHKSIDKAIYSPIDPKDVAVAAQDKMRDHIDYWLNQESKDLKIQKDAFGCWEDGWLYDVEEYEKNWDKETSNLEETPLVLRFPNQISILNFNYTSTPEKYIREGVASINNIHGELKNPESIIFGYGDEIDEDFKKLKAHRNNECLKNVKAYHYLEADNYREILSFIESDSFQVLVMGHSCGMCDRTLLNTIFEHKNCVSVKPYFYQKDDGTNDYMTLVQNISRNFNDMQLMRARVVPKTQCKPLVSKD